MNRNRFAPAAVRRLALALALAALAGCVTTTMPGPAPSAANTEKLRALQLAPVRIGAFKLAAGKPASMDAALTLRATTVKPQNGSFAIQLRDEITVELAAAGLLDRKSSAVIEGQLTDSTVDAGMGTGKGRLAARIQVRRDGQALFDKEIVAESSWESSFVGAIAIPAARDQYHALYKTLVGRLLDDAEFRQALAARQF